MGEWKSFGSSKVITQQINNVDLKTYFVGFDLDDNGDKKYRWKELINLLQNVIFEFAFGHHVKADSTRIAEQLSEAAKSIYRIAHIKEVKKIYVDEESYISDDEIDKKYLKRGEFGEIILHLILRDFHKTIPLLSKIYFKDTRGTPVHGFDAIHIEPKTKSLWLGESKLYIDPNKGIKELINDIKEHIKRDYLNDEFAIVSKKVKLLDNIPEKEYWLDLMDKNTKLSDLLKTVKIPLLCTYSSENFKKFNDEAKKEFIEAYEKEVNDLKKYFDDNNDHPLKTNLDIILLLFPVPCKIELVKRLHKKLHRLQMIEND